MLWSESGVGATSLFEPNNVGAHCPAGTQAFVDTYAANGTSTIAGFFITFYN